MLLDFYKKNSLNVPKNKDKSSPPPPSCLKSNSSDNEISLSANKQCSSYMTSSKTLDLKNTKKKLAEEALLEKVDSLTNYNSTGKKSGIPFHPRIKYSCINNKANSPSDASISPNSSAMPASVLQSPSAAAIAAAAFFRGEYRNFHQIQTQDFLTHQQAPPTIAPPNSSKNANFYIPPYYKKSSRDYKYSENEDHSQSEDGPDDEDEEESKYPSIDDIHLIEGSKSGFHSQNMTTIDTEYMSDESHKYSLIAAQALRNLEYSLSDYGGHTTEEQLYNCRHCGKKYRWKSTLRRHENVECGGKEPSHQCPYCPYKSKQRGNLGVHVRKHHANLPQLASKRRSKYSQPRD